MRILANDGIDAAGKALLEKSGFSVDTQKIEQSDLLSRIQEYDVIIVRSATRVTREVIEAGSRLKVIGRAGVGTDNIDKVAASEKGIAVVNTPAASSASVAELVFAHLFGMVRSLHDANRKMPEQGMTHFKDLKKAYSAGTELKGKTLGIIGFGRIGQETAKIALGIGMHVMYFDPYLEQVDVSLAFHSATGLPEIQVSLKSNPLSEVLQNADFVSLHVPKTDKPIIGEEQIAEMKAGAGIVNCSRGGVVDEEALIKALKSGKIAFAGLDVFAHEPPLDDTLLKLPNVSLTPHTGASTAEAQERIGIELAEKIIMELNASKGA